MNLNEYQMEALSTAIFPKDNEISYLALALCGEAGEVADKVKKVIRDFNSDFSDDEIKSNIAFELGDCLWYLANAAHAIGYSLDDIAKLNISKIKLRQQRGTLQGSGDNR